MHVNRISHAWQDEAVNMGKLASLDAPPPELVQKFLFAMPYECLLCKATKVLPSVGHRSNSLLSFSLPVAHSLILLENRMIVTTKVWPTGCLAAKDGRCLCNPPKPIRTYRTPFLHVSHVLHKHTLIWSAAIV